MSECNIKSLEKSIERLDELIKINPISIKIGQEYTPTKSINLQRGMHGRAEKKRANPGDVLLVRSKTKGSLGMSVNITDSSGKKWWIDWDDARNLKPV